MRFPEFLDNGHMKVEKLSAFVSTAFTPQERPLVVKSVKRLFDLRAISRPEGLKKTKNSNNPIENRTRDIPACSAVPLDILPKINNNTPNLWQSKNKETT